MNGASTRKAVRANFLGALCIAGLTIMGEAIQGVALATSHYTDLRQIKPIHGNAMAGAKKAALCFACHGANGIPVAPIFPRLAGQRADYLYHRLVSFKYAAPKDPYYSKSPMTPIAASLSDRDMRDLVAYFAAQRPPASGAKRAPAVAAIGRKLFLQGDPARGIPPCQGCHGADANGPILRSGQYAAYPSLRGQSAAYLVARLTSFREGQPSDTSNTFIMAGVARTLDDPSIHALAAWLSSLSASNSP